METSLRTNSGGFTAPYRSALPRVSTLTEPLSVPSFDDYRYLGARPRSIPSSLGDYGSSDSFSTYQSLAFPNTYNAYTESSMFPPASTPELSIEVLPSICSDRFANSSSYESFSEHNRSLPSMDLHSWRRTVSDLAFYDSPSFRPFVAYDPFREDDSFDPGLVTLDSDTDFHGTQSTLSTILRMNIRSIFTIVVITKLVCAAEAINASLFMIRRDVCCVVRN